MVCILQLFDLILPLVLLGRKGGLVNAGLRNWLKKTWIFMTFRSSCKGLKNNQKSKRNHWKIKLSTSAKQWISKEKSKQTSKVHTKCEKSVKKLQYVKILHLGGVPPPRFRNNIFWQILHTFCLLFNLFWTFPLKSIGFLRFQLIFRWFFNDFSGFSAYFQDILQRSIAEIEWIPHTKGWPPFGVMLIDDFTCARGWVTQRP